MLVKFKKINDDGSTTEVLHPNDMKPIVKSYLREKSIRVTEGYTCFMYGPESDAVAAKFSIPSGFKTREGWVLSKNRFKKIHRWLLED